MIISPGRRYIFVHIPKTGGTSMALALEDRAMKDDILIGDTPKAKRRKGRLRGIDVPGRLWKHATLADVDGLVTATMARDFFVFTMVRNPWDRMVSYFHWLQAQTFDHPAVALAERLGFGDFLRHPQIQSSISAMPYAHYVTDAGGRACADAYVRLEHLDEDLAPVSQHLGFALSLPQVNTSDRAADYRLYYEDDDAAIVAELCAQDIQKFGYRFD